MSRIVITIVNRKGGTGKTTSAAYLAMCLHKAGRKVTGIDTDPDQSWQKWCASGALPYEVVALSQDTLTESVDELGGDIVIDTPPNDGEIIFKASGLADEVIIPLAPTALDINRLMTTIKTVADIERMRGKALASVLLTRWRETLNVSKEVETVLKEQSIPLLDARVRHLTRYTGFDTPQYLDEYQAVLTELEVLHAKG